MKPETLQDIRLRLSSVLPESFLIRTLPERSDSFQESVDERSIVSVYWEESSRVAESETADGIHLKVMSTLLIDLRLWGMLSDEGAIGISNAIIRALIGYRPSGAKLMNFSRWNFQGYSQVTKRWVCEIRFDVETTLISGIEPEPWLDPVPTVREINYEGDITAVVRSVFQTDAIAISKPANPVDWKSFEILNFVDELLLSLPIASAYLARTPSGVDRVSIKLVESAIVRTGIPAFARIISDTGAEVLRVAAGLAGQGGVIQMFDLTFEPVYWGQLEIDLVEV